MRFMPFLFVLGLLATPAVGEDRPNVVVIMLDDMGFSDPGCFGGEIDTPNIDRLAENGLRFTRFYNAARCCPTRAALLTGLYPHQVNMGRNGRSLGRSGVTLAEALGRAGYQTAMSGKWHLSVMDPLRPRSRQLKWLNHRGFSGRPFAPLDTYPVNRGFDRHYGTIWGVVNYFDPYSLVDGTEPVREVPDDYYVTDALSRRAAEYVGDMAERDAPFFLYVAHFAPHWPLHAPEETIAKYEGRYSAGWHELRQSRYRRQVEMGLIDAGTHPLPALMGRGKHWDELSRERQKLEARRMAVHAAMVDRADRGIGTVIESLREAGELDNTVIFVLSDNGASPERYVRPGLDRPSRTREGEKIRYEPGTFMPGPETTWGYFGSYWANAVNTPFRYWKKESFEGGNHTPLVVHWPAGLKTEPGATTDQRGHVIDLMPTCLELAGAEYPERFNGHRIKSFEGRSLLPILRDESRDGHNALYFEHVGGKAVMEDGWKAVQPSGGKRWRLYHLAEDRTETNDLAGKRPKKLRQLLQSWAGWADRVGAPYDESSLGLDQ